MARGRGAAGGVYHVESNTGVMDWQSLVTLEETHCRSCIENECECSLYACDWDLAIRRLARICEAKHCRLDHLDVHGIRR